MAMVVKHYDQDGDGHDDYCGDMVKITDDSNGFLSHATNLSSEVFRRFSLRKNVWTIIYQLLFSFAVGIH
jgi:hypothetical protein